MWTWIGSDMGGSKVKEQRLRGIIMKKNKTAFTLIELLVVIAIIALLVSILLPSLNKAKDLAKEAVCKSSQHGMGLAFGMYISEQNGLLPLAYNNAITAYDVSKFDSLWFGALYVYSGADKELFRCPDAEDIASAVDEIPNWIHVAPDPFTLYFTPYSVSYGYNYGYAMDGAWGVQTPVDSNVFQSPSESILVTDTEDRNSSAYDPTYIVKCIDDPTYGYTPTSFIPSTRHGGGKTTNALMLDGSSTSLAQEDFETEELFDRE